jgi:hypothetical protein
MKEGRRGETGEWRADGIRHAAGGRRAENGVPHVQEGGGLVRMYLKRRPKTEFVMLRFKVTNSCSLIVWNLLTTKAR